MVGRACSHDKYGCFRYVLISVYFSEEILPGALADEEYLYDRHDRTIIREPSDGTDSECEVSYSVFIGIYDRLDELETSKRASVVMEWRYNAGGTLDILGYEVSGDAWLPVSVSVGCRQFAALKVSGGLLECELRPLEASFVSDVMNLLIYEMGIKASAAFCADGGVLFAGSELVRIIRRLFGRDAPGRLGLSHSAVALKRARRDDTMKPQLLPLRSSMLKRLRNMEYPPTVYRGDEQLFAIGVGRDAVSDGAAEIASCIEKGLDVLQLAHRLAHIFCASFEKLEALGKLLVARGHVDRLSDVYYLTYSEFLGALTFAEDALALRKTVRTSRERCRRLAGYNIADVISCKSALYYIEEKIKERMT